MKSMKTKVMKVVASAGAGIASIGTAIATYTPNYTPADMPNIATDVIGSAGVEVKQYMPLIILTFIAMFVVARVALIRRAYTM